MPQTKPAKTNLTCSLDVARRDLLDLGLRNPLLNYKVLRGKGLDIVDEKPIELCRILVREEKRMTFLPGEPRGLPSSDRNGQLAQPGGQPTSSSRHSDLRLQTEYASPQLQSRLLATFHAARTCMEEQGVNTLYLALGMLNWREHDNSEKFNRAPLILIPVTLERSNALERFHLKYSGEDLGENISLAEKLKQEFGVREFPELPDPEDLDVTAYFRAVETVVRGRAGWSVDTNAVALGFFSFAKFLMYRDLDATSWPMGQGLQEHSIIQSLFGDAGFQSSAPTYEADKLLDDQHRGRDTIQVVDADSSQTIALLEAINGQNMVIQGPPGTGKSQTIVNLIAAAVAEGKKVLFVSEKMAALDVVKRRLDRLGLGEPCLELHSNRSNKKTIIEELKRTAFVEKRVASEFQTELALLANSREKLNAYCKSVNEPIGNSGDTPRSAYGKRLTVESELRGIETPPLRIEAAANWTAVDSSRRALLVKQLQDRLSHSGPPRRHPFWGTRLTMILPTDKDEIRDLVARASSAAANLDSSSRILAETCLVAAPSNPANTVLLAESAKYMSDRPDLAGIDAKLPEWLSSEAELREILRLGKFYRDIRNQYDGVLSPDAWAKDVAELRQVCSECGGKWWRFFSGRWRHAKQGLASLCVGVPPSSQPTQIALLDAIAGASAAAAKITTVHERMKTLFPFSWAGLTSDWDLLERQTSWVAGAQRGIQCGSLGSWCIDQGMTSLDRAELGSQVQHFYRTHKAFSEALHAWIEKLRIDESRFENPLLSQAFSALICRWEEQIARLDDLHALVSFNQLIAECEKEGLQALAPIASEWEPAATCLVPVYERARLAALLDRAFSERPTLASFNGGTHAQVVEHFRRLDLLQLDHNSALLSARHTQSLPTGGGTGEIGVLWREFQKRAKFLPIRSLMSKAGHAIQSIKPVFMMSPLSIANYLPPEALRFDLVIFDEASQVKPVDALGAIARGKQIVVVGDSKQMPPTSFFDSLTGSDDSEEEGEGVATSDIESILGLFRARGTHERMLRWHYRSRHESLITVSNHLFYDDQLVVFPSPARERTTLGLVYRYLEKAWYDRGRTRTNPVEAETVAAAVMAHAKNQLKLPREQWETLGVAAFSTAQMIAILDRLELLRRQDTSCEEFFSYPPHEPFFVKNLENVQGDERDVIFISVGYGRTAEGFLTMSFGPLNRTGGERRLNVLISRARKRCEVFTNLRGDDIDVSKTGSAGVAALKTFLHYAETGQLDVPTQTGRPPDSDFEEHVLRRLTALGHEVHAQVGSAGFFLDLAVVDSANPGRYLLGIECDGAAYHSARSARDRDRLRQAVLEGLGWRIHRIWSTDWFHNPEQELRKVAQAIESAQAAMPAAPRPTARTIETERPKPAVLPPAKPPQQQHSLPPYEFAHVGIRLGDVEMHRVDRTQLADLLAQVVQVESPVHRTEAARRVLNGAGVQRCGARIQQAFEEAVQVGASRKLFVMRKEFLWTTAMQQPPVRDRSILPTASRKFEFVAPEEIRSAILFVVQESHGIAREEVAAAVCRLLGFVRVTEEMTAGVEQHGDYLVGNGYLALQGVNLVPVPRKLQ